MKRSAEDTCRAQESPIYDVDAHVAYLGGIQTFFYI